MKYDEAPRLPKLPFILGDLALVILAWVIADRHPNPFSPLPLLVITGCVVAGCISLMIPFLVNYVRDQEAAAASLRRELAEQFKKILVASEHLQHSTVQLKTIEETAAKTLQAAEVLPYRLQEKIAEFNEQLAAAEESERDALTLELEALHAAESKRLAAVASQIGQLTAEWTKLEADTRAAFATAAQFEPKLLAAAAVLDTKVAAVDSKFAELDARIAALDAAVKMAKAISWAPQPPPALVPSPLVLPVVAPPPVGPVAESPSLVTASMPAAEMPTATPVPESEPVPPPMPVLEPMPAPPSETTSAPDAAPAAVVEPVPAAVAQTMEPAVAPETATAPAAPAPVAEATATVAAPEAPATPVTAQASPTPPRKPRAPRKPKITPPEPTVESTPSAPMEPAPAPAAGPPADPITELSIEPSAEIIVKTAAEEQPSASTIEPTPVVEPAPTPIAEASAPVAAPEASDTPTAAPASPTPPRKSRAPRKPKVQPPAPVAEPEPPTPAIESAPELVAAAVELIAEPVADEPPPPEDFSQVPPEEGKPAGVPSPDGRTRLTVISYIGIGNKLHLRGDGAGLSWDKGVPLQFISIGRWRWETGDATEPVTCKIYKNDKIEAPVGNIVLAPGTEQEVNAQF
jgi:hypothetical protein